MLILPGEEELHLQLLLMSLYLMNADVHVFFFANFYGNRNVLCLPL